MTVLVAQLCLTLCDLTDYSPTGSYVHGILLARILEWVAMASSRGIFPTQGLNPGLLHCRQILYHLSHQGSPIDWIVAPYSEEGEHSSIYKLEFPEKRWNTTSLWGWVYHVVSKRVWQRELSLTKRTRQEENLWSHRLCNSVSEETELNSKENVE